MLRPVTLAVLGLLVASETQAEVARHGRPDFKAIRRGKKTVGFTVKVEIDNTGFGSHKKVRMSLGSANQAKAGVGMEVRRQKAYHRKKGYLRHVLGNMTIGNERKTKTFSVMYGQNNDLKPGETVDFVSAFTGGTLGANHIHVYGMKYGPFTNQTAVYTLPK